MRIALFLAVLAICGCKAAPKPNKAEILEREYAEQITSADRCNIGTRIADAWLESGEESNYRHWKVRADTYCMKARMGIEDPQVQAAADKIMADAVAQAQAIENAAK